MTGSDAHELKVKFNYRTLFLSKLCHFDNLFQFKILWSLSLRKKRTYQHSVLCAQSLAPLVTNLTLFLEKHKEENEDIIFIINQRKTKVLNREMPNPNWISFSQFLIG